MGGYAALIMAGIVFYINADHGWLLATTSGLKQAAYTFFFGGSIIKLLETIAVKIRKPVIAVTVSVTVTTLLTTALVFAVHNLKGTPKPLMSTIPTIIITPPGFVYLAHRKRKEDRMKN